MTDLAIAPVTAETMQLAIPGLDGYRAEKLALTFSGSVDLDRTSQDDLDFVNGLKLGREVELRVTATVAKKGFTLQTREEGEIAGYGVGLKIHSLDVV